MTGIMEMMIYALATEYSFFVVDCETASDV
jgi:hypothetical protein